MPIIRVSAFKRPVEKKRELAKALTETLMRVYGLPPESAGEVYVIFDDKFREEWAKAGVLYCDR